MEPPPNLTIQAARPWAILDDFFPNLLTGFRVAEYNAYLQAFPQVRVLSCLPDFLAQHAVYAARYPDLACRVQPYSPEWLRGCELAYLNFLNNAVFFLPALEHHGVAFILTLYPGGGFGLNEPESDAKLTRVLASKLLQAIIVTQPVTHDYLRAFARQRQLHLPPVHPIDGLVVNPIYFAGQPLPPVTPSAANSQGLNICFVAERYMPLGANKGYPDFIAAALALADLSHLQFHVVGGGFTPQEIDVSALGKRIQFHGRLDTDHLRRFFSDMDLIISPNQPRLLHPGNFDGFPTGCCVEAALCGVAVMATDALQQNPGYVDGESIFLLDAAAPLSQQIESRLRDLSSQSHKLTTVGESGQALTRHLYAPERQIGARQRILREVAARQTPQKPATVQQDGATP